MTTFRTILARRIPTALAIAGTVVACSVATSVAGQLLTGSSIKNESLTGSDVKNASIGSVDVTNGSLGLADLSAVAKTALTGQTGAVGPAGPAGPAGTPGAAGPRGLSAWDEIPLGQTVTGTFYERYPNDTAGIASFSVNLPGTAPAPLTSANVNFAPSVIGADVDATCTGTVTAPTAPAGKVCIYPNGTTGLVANSALGTSDLLASRGFRVIYSVNAANVSFSGTWAYNAG